MGKQKNPDCTPESVQGVKRSALLRCETLLRLLSFASLCQSAFIAVPDICQIIQQPLQTQELIMSAAGRLDAPVGQSLALAPAGGV
jgi:hypothetical protein